MRGQEQHNPPSDDGLGAKAARLPRRGLESVARASWWGVRRLSAPMRQDRRGMALLLAMVAIAVMSVSVVEFAYQTRVNVFVAANARDDLKAFYLARSGMNLGVLLLDFQFELERDPLIGRFMRRSNFQLYPLVNLLLTPFQSGRLDTPIGGIDLGDSGARGFGGFHGSFELSIEPEEGKVNINRFNDQSLDQATMTQLCILMQGEQHNDLFETDLLDSAYKVNRNQLIGNIVDWVDGNSTRVLLNDFCIPEGEGSGDESTPYARHDADYEVKNAKMTTIEELRMVHGFNDLLYERFAESFTVYPVDKINLNLANFFVIQSLLCSNVAGVSADNWPCRDPNVAFQVLYLSLALDGVREFFANPLNLLFYYMNSENAPAPLDGAKKGQTVAYLNTRQLLNYINTFKTNPIQLQQFIAYSPTARTLLGPEMIAQLAVNVPQLIIDFDTRSMLRRVTTQSPKVFKIVATGTYGNTTKTLVSVVDFSRQDSRFLYYREY